jgi:hypothetical protein
MSVQQTNNMHKIAETTIDTDHNTFCDDFTISAQQYVEFCIKKLRRKNISIKLVIPIEDKRI